MSKETQSGAGCAGSNHGLSKPTLTKQNTLHQPVHATGRQHSLLPVAEETGGILMPNRSRAERNVPLASTGHCTVSGVLGDGRGTEIQGESLLEANHQYVLNAVPNIVELREQVRFFYGWDHKKLRQHIFDLVAVLSSGERIAFAIKPEFRLQKSNRDKLNFNDEMRIVAWWAYQKNFVDDVRILTDADLDQVALHNAKVLAAVREADLEADDVALRAVSDLPLKGCLSLRELTLKTGMGARGYRALLRLVRDGRAYLAAPGKICPKTLVAFAASGRSQLVDHRPRMLVPSAQPAE